MFFHTLTFPAARLLLTPQATPLLLLTPKLGLATLPLFVVANLTTSSSFYLAVSASPAAHHLSYPPDPASPLALDSLDPEPGSLVAQTTPQTPIFALVSQLEFDLAVKNDPVLVPQLHSVIDSVIVVESEAEAEAELEKLVSELA